VLKDVKINVGKVKGKKKWKNGEKVSVIEKKLEY
jgi:hypothetical protein